MGLGHAALWRRERSKVIRAGCTSLPNYSASFATLFVARLDAAGKMLPGIRTIQNDVSDPAAIANLCRQVIDEFPSLNMLINNAGIMRKINLQTFGSDFQNITHEVEINLNGSIGMVTQLLPRLKTQKRAALDNVSSGLAFVPLPMSPVYCATKAALRSFTQSLRIQLKDANVTVFELASPLTETPLFKDDFGAEEAQGRLSRSAQPNRKGGSGLRLE
jgi:uncharacterized oxidoreductase